MTRFYRSIVIPTIFLIEGPVGAGKSTYAAQLSFEHHAPHINLDEWMATLFSPDRPDTDFVAWYTECKQRCIQQIWDVTSELQHQGISAVLELGLVQQADRLDFYQRVDATDFELKVILLDTPIEVRRQRVKRRNEEKSGTYKMEVSDEMFTLANSFWQAPSDQEIEERMIEVISST